MKKTPDKPKVELTKETFAALKELVVLDEEAKARGKKQLLEAMANEKQIEEGRQEILSAADLNEKEYLALKRRP